MSQNRRPDLSLTAEELRALLAAVPHGVLVTLGVDGAPTAVPALVRLGGDGMLELRVHPEAHVLSTLAVGDRVGCSVERSAAYADIEGATLEGLVVSRHGTTVLVDVVRTVSFAFAKSNR